MSVRNMAVGILMVGAVLYLPACTRQGTTPDKVPPPVRVETLFKFKKVASPEYSMTYGDVVEVKFLYHPEMSDRMRIRPDGYISVPIFQDILCAGKTPGQLRDELLAMFEEELKNPEITVIVREFAGRVAYIGGEVGSPQMIPMGFPMSVMQAIIATGGLKPTARKDSILVIRSTPGGAPQLLTVNIEAIRNGLSQDILLESGDIVFAPKSNVADVGEFVELYINRILPRSVTFPFIYELRSDD